MAKLVWRVKLVAEVRLGVVTETEVGRIERDDKPGLGELGLQLAEMKQLAAARQAEMVPTQMSVLGERCRVCVGCGGILAGKGYYPATFRSLFGDVADDLDHLRNDPGFKLACGRPPDSGSDLCSQPTVSRWENAPTLREVVRMTYAMVDSYCASYRRPPRAVTLDIDDTVDVVHGHQQLSLFNGHYDERCFLPIHVYDTATSRPVAVLLRTGTTPSGVEIRGLLQIEPGLVAKTIDREKASWLVPA